MPAYFPADANLKSNINTYSAAVRSDGSRGFVFISNYERITQKRKERFPIAIKFESEKMLDTYFDVDANGYGIIPFNYRIGSQDVAWISAIPQYVDNGVLYIAKNRGIDPLISIDGNKVENIHNGMVVGGLSLEFIEEEKTASVTEEKLILREEGVSTDISFCSHIVNYDGSKPAFSHSKSFSFDLPKGANYIRIRAMGNIASLYLDDILISDYYLFGVDWIVDVKDIPENKKLILKIVPLDERDKEKIYWEFDMPIGDFIPDVFVSYSDFIFQ